MDLWSEYGVSAGSPAFAVRQPCSTKKRESYMKMLDFEQRKSVQINSCKTALEDPRLLGRPYGLPTLEVTITTWQSTFFRSPNLRLFFSKSRLCTI